MRRSLAVLALCVVDALRPLTKRTRLRSANSPDLEEEARIRAKLEDHAAQQRGRHAKKKLSPAAQRRRAKRGGAQLLLGVAAALLRRVVLELRPYPSFLLEVRAVRALEAGPLR